MKIVCAWCNKDMGVKDGEGIEGTSHSICHDCLAKELNKIKGGNGNESKGGHIALGEAARGCRDHGQVG